MFVCVSRSNDVSVGIIVKVIIMDEVSVSMMVSVIGLKSLFFRFCSDSSGRNMMVMIDMFDSIGIVIVVIVWWMIVLCSVGLVLWFCVCVMVVLMFLIMMIVVLMSMFSVIVSLFRFIRLVVRFI